VRGGTRGNPYTAPPRIRRMMSPKHNCCTLGMTGFAQSREEAELNLDEARELLERRRAELQERRTRIERHTRHRDEPLPPDFAEQAVELENGETLVALDREVNAELKEIERALKRLADGTFGECTRCGETISEGRLSALPYASLCIDCANATDAAR